MELDARLALIFLAIETAGVSLTAVLLALLARESGRGFARWWATGWTVLAAAHATLLAWLAAGRGQAWLLLPYLAGEYTFAVLMARGFTLFRLGPCSWRRQRWFFAILAVWTLGLLWAAGDTPDHLFRVHAIAMGGLMLVALEQAYRVTPPGQHRTGRRVAVAALLALSIDAVGLAALEWLDAGGLASAQALLPFSALIDLVLLTALGFGEALLVMELLSADLQQTNRELAAARDRMAEQARIDPLTRALNRHAFHTLFGERAGAYAHTSGCVVVIDIDNLKGLNDSMGHAAGDQAIRTAAGLIRQGIRADDLLFRWGGDEFLAILFWVSEEATEARLRALNERRRNVPGQPHLSWGIARFDGADSLGLAIEQADRAMYEGRARRRDAAG